MHVTTIRYLKRIQEAQFEPAELEITAQLLEGESAEKAILDLKTLVEDGLRGTLGSHAPVGQKVTEPVKTEPVKETVTKEKPLTKAQQKKLDDAAKMAAISSDKLENGQDIPPVIPQEEVTGKDAGGTSSVAGTVDTKNVSTVESQESVAGAGKLGKGIVAYDAGVKEHRSRFATFLGNKYPKWTPDAKFGKETQSPEKEAYKAQVLEFSKGLQGLPFEDAKGNMLESFQAKLETFFGAK